MTRLSLLLVLLACGFSAQAQTIVERHGQLSVVGNKIKDECNRNVQLRGPSYFWSQWEGKRYWTNGAVKWLRDDWKATIVRAAMGVRDGGAADYLADPTTNRNQVITVVDAAIDHGIYVIIDWHAHPNKTNEAKAFFADMAQRYKGRPNVIYEIWNEPIGDFGTQAAQRMWDNELKQYAREVIASIRDHDTENLIVMGTPFYCQYPNVVVNNKVTTDSKGRNVKNLAYTIHAYAGAHGQAVRNQAQEALDGGLALFMTECGRVGTNYGPNNNTDQAEWDRWEAWMDQNKISWTKWSLSDKNEVSSSLQPGSPANGNWNVNNDLTAEGRWTRNKLRNKNASLPSGCDDGGGGNDAITNVTAPNNVRRGQSVTVAVSYEASTNRDLQVAFQRDNSPYTTYVSRKVDVGSGSGTRNVTFTIPSNVPIRNDDYQFQVFLTTDNGTWGQRLDNEAKLNVDCLAPATDDGARLNIYTDNFNDQWANWSWGGSATARDGGVKRSGSFSFKYRFNNGGGAVSFRHPNGKGANNLDRIEFWARTWNSTDTYSVSGSYDDNDDNRGSSTSISVSPTWKKYTFTKAQLGNYGWYKRFFIQTNANKTIFLDDVRLVYSGGSASLRAPDVSGISTIEAIDARVYPNPSGGLLTLEVELPTDGAVGLMAELVDVSGRLIQGIKLPGLDGGGQHRVELDFRRQASPGLYFLRLRDAAGSVALSKRVVIR